MENGRLVDYPEYPRVLLAWVMWFHSMICILSLTEVWTRQNGFRAAAAVSLTAKGRRPRPCRFEVCRKNDALSGRVVNIMA